VRTRRKDGENHKKAVNKLQNKKPASYAQAANIKNIKAALGAALNAPPKIHLKKEKRVTVKIPNKIKIESIKY
jgi:predicted DNA binding CopG/RHH family protein